MKRAKFLFNHFTQNNWQPPRIATFEPKDHLFFQNVVHELKLAIPTNDYVSRALSILVNNSNSDLVGFNLLFWQAKTLCGAYIRKYLVDPKCLSDYFPD